MGITKKHQSKSKVAANWVRHNDRTGKLNLKPYFKGAQWESLRSKLEVEYYNREVTLKEEMFNEPDRRSKL